MPSAEWLSTAANARAFAGCGVASFPAQSNRPSCGTRACGVSEICEMMLANDRLKEITWAFREIDPDRNGFVTQQELDDIFRENYR